MKNPKSKMPPTIPDLYRWPVWIDVFPRKITKPPAGGIVDGHQFSTPAIWNSSPRANSTSSLVKVAASTKGNVSLLLGTPKRDKMVRPPTPDPESETSLNPQPPTL